MATKTLAAAALAAIISTTAAHANIVTTSRSGYWEAAQGTNNSGRNTCMVTTSMANGTGLIVFSVGQGDARLSVGAYKSTWNIPNGMAMPMAVQIDANNPWVSLDPQDQNNARGNMGSIWVVITPSFAREAVHQITSGSTIRLDFSGTEPSWTASLSGTSGVWASFMHCAQQTAPAWVASINPSPSQPFAVGPAQPYSNPPTSQLSQPFTKL